MVIVEYCKYGNLSNYLKSKRDLFCLSKVRVRPGHSAALAYGSRPQSISEGSPGRSLSKDDRGTPLADFSLACLVTFLRWLRPSCLAMVPLTVKGPSTSIDNKKKKLARPGFYRSSSF